MKKVNDNKEDKNGVQICVKCGINDVEQVPHDPPSFAQKRSCLHHKLVESEKLGDFPGAFEEVADVNCAEVVIKFLE